MKKQRNVKSLEPLSGNQTNAKKATKSYIVCDIETQNWTKFLVIGVYDGKSIFHFNNLSKFLDHIFDHHDGADCFAHFGGRFDFLFILGEIIAKRKDIAIGDMVPRGSGILCFDITRDDGRQITLRDSSALLPFSLKRLTEAFGVEHIKQEWDHSKTNGVTPELLRYLDFDLKGTYECLEKFFSWPKVQQAGAAYTMASQAMRVLRTYLKDPVSSISYGLEKEIRPAFLGGRTEIFKMAYKNPKKPLYCFDVNSLYPAVMALNVFPGAFKQEVMSWQGEKELGIYHAKVNMPSMYIPPLGIVKDKKYVFPVGNFSGFFTSAELAYAKSLGATFEVELGWIFETAGQVFKGFITDLWAQRLEAQKRGDGVTSTLCKLLMNSCYGRFGMNRSKELLVFDDGENGFTPLSDHNGRDVEFKTEEGGVCRLGTRDTFLETFNHVGIAAFVTSYARIHMHKLMMEAPKAMYYTDTDSLYTTHKYKTSEGLGGLKLENECFDACFLLPKTYRAGEKTAMKGFDQKKIHNFTMEDFYSYLEGDLKELSLIEEPRFATLKTAVRMGAIVSMTEGGKKTLRARYDKRVRIENYETKAIRL